MGFWDGLEEVTKFTYVQNVIFQFNARLSINKMTFDQVSELVVCHSICALFVPANNCGDREAGRWGFGVKSDRGEASRLLVAFPAWQRQAEGRHRARDRG